MSVKIIEEESRTVAVLSGEIDHHNAKNLRMEIDFALRENQPQELILDFSDVGFMDSSGTDWLWEDISLCRSLTVKLPSEIRPII